MLKELPVKGFLYLSLGLLAAACGSSTNTQPASTNTNTPLTAPTDTPTITPTEDVFGDEVSYQPQEAYAGLSIVPGGDHDTRTMALPDEGGNGFISGNGSPLLSNDGNNDPDYYIQFRVDDEFLYEGSPTSRVVFVIEYLDEGTDTFNIQYDAQSGGPYGDGKYKDTRMVIKTGTGEIKTVEIPICDAFFANRDQDADFRISDSGDGAETFRRVAVRKGSNATGPIEVNVDSCGANPYDDQPDSDAIQTCISYACSGDTILFTSGVDDSGYQGYLIDKTIFLVYPDAKSDLTFQSTDEDNHALLQATADLKGFVVHLLPRSVVNDHGLIDNITLQHLDLDGNRAERLCTGDRLPGQNQAIAEGENDNWGSWLPECSPENGGDPWCNPGTLYFGGEVDHSDPAQDYEAHPDRWSTGMVVQDVVLSNTECGTAFYFSGANYRIDSVTVDTAGEHVHAPGCAMTDPDDPVSAWSDGMTFVGPAHRLTNNLIVDASDVGIASFGGRDIVIADNIVRARPGNYGMFAGIVMGPNTLGLITGLQVTGNQIVNEADPTCGGIHAGIVLGVHAWANGCMGNPAPATYGIAEDCSIFSPAPEGALCDTDTFCRTWGYIPAGGTLTLRDNTVTGSQVSYIISGLDVLGEMDISGNESIDPHLTDWEDDAYCVWTEGYADSWGVLDFVAHNPTIEGWTDQRIVCMR
ncbi:MAG: hypothetical protein P8Z41_00720 [Anaerolineales bacterium]